MLDRAIVRLLGVGLAAVVVADPDAAAQTCQAIIQQPTPGQSFNGLIRDLAAFDDGSGIGMQAYVCGQFTQFGGRPVGCVVRLVANGQCVPVGNGGLGLGGSARAIGGLTEASGRSRLFAAGGFAGGNIAAWDGTSWAISTAPFSTPVFTLKALDLGEGPRLFAGLWGGGVWAFDGETWSRVGSAAQASAMSRCQALAAFDDDGDGPNPVRLYVAGSFVLGPSISGLARFDGAQWVGVPGAPSFGWAKSLEVFDDGRGKSLYVGSHPGGGVAANACIARWDGLAWTFPPGPNNQSGFDPAYALSAIDMGDGFGARLFSYTTNGTIRSDTTGPWSMFNLSLRCSAASQVDYRSTMLAYHLPGARTPVLVVPDASHRALVRTIGCSRCAVDLDFDGVATVGDVFRFLGFWFESGAGADFDASGEVTIDDLFQFLNAWYGGCGG